MAGNRVSKCSEREARKEFLRLSGLKDEQVSVVESIGKVADSSIYEVWHQPQSEWFVSFMLCSPQGEFQKLENSKELIELANANTMVAQLRIEERKDNRLKTIVAAVAFLITTGALVVLAFKSSAGERTAILTTLSAIIASGSISFFRVWVVGRKILTAPRQTRG